MPPSLLAAWTALEILSPQPFKIADFDRSQLASLDRSRLPWEGDGEKSLPHRQLYYQVAFGTIDLGAAVRQLLAVDSDRRIERPSAEREVLAGVVILDRHGRLVETPAVFLSSFAWGLPLALRGDLGRLASWQDVEKDLHKDLEEVLRRADQESEGARGAPLDRATLLEAWEWLVRALDLPADLIRVPRLAIRSYVGFKSGDAPEPLLSRTSAHRSGAAL